MAFVQKQAMLSYVYCFLVDSTNCDSVNVSTDAETPPSHNSQTHTHTSQKNFFFIILKSQKERRIIYKNFKQEQVFIYGKASEEVTCHYERVDYIVLVGRLATLQTFIL